MDVPRVPFKQVAKTIFAIACLLGSLVALTDDLFLSGLKYAYTTLFQFLAILALVLFLYGVSTSRKLKAQNTDPIDKHVLSRWNKPLYSVAGLLYILSLLLTIVDARPEQRAVLLGSGKWEAYRANDGSFQLSLPARWIPMPQTSTQEFLLSMQDPATGASLTVSSPDIFEELNRAKYWEIPRPSPTNGSLEKVDKAEVGGHPAVVRTVLSISRSGLSYTLYVVKHRERVVSFRFQTTRDRFKAYEPTFRRIIATVMFADLPNG